MDLLEANIVDDEQKEQINLVQASAAILMNITNDLLDFSKLENGALQIYNAKMSLKTLTDSCIAAVRRDAEEIGLNISYDDSYIAKSNVPMQIMGDVNRLRQVLLNILENAVKFTPRGGTVSLTITVMPAEKTDAATPMLRFEISDTGIGISPEQQASVFEKYRRVSSSTARNYGGTGLGLAICRGLVEAMGGKIGVSSELNVGSVFFFEIPLKLPPASHSVGRATKELQSSEATRVREDVRPLHILVVEDNKINQKVVRAMLQRMGHTVTVADDGKIGVEQVQKNGESFGLVLMDRMMPVMDGIQATKAIRDLGFSKTQLPIVGLTASFQRSELDFYLDAGMNDCLGKPVKLGLLRTAISRVATGGGS